MRPTTREPRPAWETVAIVLWVGAAVAMAARFFIATDLQRSNVYLKVYAVAAEDFLNGSPLYGSESGFRYPPMSAVLFLPFYLCGPIVGSILWRWLNLAALLLGFWSTQRIGFPFKMTRAETGFFLSWFYVFNNLNVNNGQANPLILGLLLLAASAGLRSRDKSAAVAVAVASILKVYPLVYGMVLGILRPSLLKWLVAALALGLVLPITLQSPAYVLAEYRALLDSLAHDVRTANLANAYRDIRLVVAAAGWSIPDPAYYALGAMSGAGIAALCWWSRRCRLSSVRTAEYALSLTVCWIVLFGPATEKSTFALISAATLWPLIAAWRSGHRGWLTVWITVNVLIGLDHLPIPIGREFQAAHPALRCLHTYASLLAAVALAIRAVLDCRRAATNRRSPVSSA